MGLVRSRTRALELLEGVLARGVILARAVINEHCLLSVQVQVLLELLASAAALVTDLRLEVSQVAAQRDCAQEDCAPGRQVFSEHPELGPEPDSCGPDAALNPPSSPLRRSVAVHL